MKLALLFTYPYYILTGPEDNKSRPQYGVDPRIMRNIEVDLSEERMKAAWESYKDRWKREEEALKQLEEKKLVIFL